jgi:hypothetical protein
VPRITIESDRKVRADVDRGNIGQLRMSVALLPFRLRVAVTLAGDRCDRTTGGRLKSVTSVSRQNRIAACRLSCPVSTTAKLGLRFARWLHENVVLTNLGTEGVPCRNIDK